MTKRKIIICLIVLGFLFLATLFLIFFHQKLFNIGADVSPSCSISFCNKAENYDSCRTSCAGKNPSIQTGIFFGGNRGVVQTSDLDFIAAQHKLVYTLIERADLNGPSYFPHLTNYADEVTLALKILANAKYVKEKSKTVNSDLKLLYYQSAIRINRTANDISENDYNSADWSVSIPETCFLHTVGSDGQPILDKAHRIHYGANLYFIDPSSSCWQNKYSNDIYNQLLPSSLADSLTTGNDFFDGVNMDEARPIAPGSKSQLGNDMVSNWATYVSKLLSVASKKMKTISPNKLAFYNGIKCDIWKDSPDCNAYQIETNPDLDGTALEWYSYASSKFQPYDIFKKQLDLVVKINAMGKMVWAGNIVFEPTGTDITSKPVRTLQRSLLASYLLAQGDHTYYGIAMGQSNDEIEKVAKNPSQYIHNGVFSFAGWFPDWNVDIGKSIGAYQESTPNDSTKRVFSRDFSKALVVYNADPVAKNFVLPSGKTFYTPEGEQVSGSINLTANQGQILLKNNQTNIGSGSGSNNTNNNSNQNSTVGSTVKQLISTGSSSYLIILIVIAILITILLWQYLKKSE